MRSRDFHVIFLSIRDNRSKSQGLILSSSSNLNLSKVLHPKNNWYIG